MSAGDGIRIVPATAISPEALRDLQHDVLPRQRLEDQWRWRYRSAWRDSRFPLVMVEEGRAIAHAGGIPFRVRVGERELRSAWFVDFAVRAGQQRRGLGRRLTQAWMDASELAVTFCNEDSMAVFAKLGWIGSFDTRLHVVWVKPFDHPRAIALRRAGRATANALVAPALAALRRRLRPASPDLQPIASLDLASLVESGEDGADLVAPVRDREYWSWRIASSPDREVYRVFREADVVMLLKLRHDRRSSIDVLWVSDTREAATGTVRRMIAGLTGWALDHDYSCVRVYSPSRGLDDALRPLLPMVGRPRFAFYSADAEVMARMGRARWRWQLLDSDFEWI